MFSIGEFSRVTGITVKALRFYHEQGLLVPTHVDESNGYRFYDAALIDRARTIVFLRRLELGLDEIGTLLASIDEPAAIRAALERHKPVLRQRIRTLRGAVRLLDQFLADERQIIAMRQINDDVTVKTLEPMLAACVRMKGRYADSGQGFGRIGRAFGRHIAGLAFLLHHDTEYKADDADFEACMPVRQAREVAGISVRALSGGRCVSLIHKGPYDQLGPSYAKAFQHAKDNGYAIASPTREVYIKGPGMLFKGNPKNYVTEIQLPIAEKDS